MNGTLSLPTPPTCSEGKGHNSPSHQLWLIPWRLLSQTELRHFGGALEGNAIPVFSRGPRHLTHLHQCSQWALPSPAAVPLWVAHSCLEGSWAKVPSGYLGSASSPQDTWDPKLERRENQAPYWAHGNKGCRWMRDPYTLKPFQASQHERKGTRWKSTGMQLSCTKGHTDTVSLSFIYHTPSFNSQSNFRWLLLFVHRQQINKLKFGFRSLSKATRPKHQSVRTPRFLNPELLSTTLCYFSLIRCFHRHLSSK